MKSIRSKTGPFSERPYFTHDEIDQMCIEELRAVGLYPTGPEAIRIDRFIEKRFKVVPTYQELGPGILGLTRFGSQGVTDVIVSRALDEENTETSERRIRSTLAHEVGHGLLHAYLFALATQAELFEDATSATPKILCRDEGDPSNSMGYHGKWWEYQANRAIGGLLLPRPLVMLALDDFHIPQGLLGLTTLDTTRRYEATQRVAEVFKVNPAVVRIRLNELYPATPMGQQML